MSYPPEPSARHFKFQMSISACLLFAFLLISCRLSFAALAVGDPPGFKSESKSFKGTTFRVVTVDTKKIDLRMHWKKPDGTAYAMLNDYRAACLLRGDRFLFATNAGIYDTSLRPLGLYIENGKILRPINRSKGKGGNFSMVPNGVFLLRGLNPEVIDTEEYKPDDGIRFATQSGPLLLRNGKIHPLFSKESTNRKLRSGVGVDANGRAVFAISSGVVNFYDFAEFFKLVMNCENALYLDGTISQFLVGLESEAIQGAPFVGLITATLRDGNSTAQ